AARSRAEAWAAKRRSDPHRRDRGDRAHLRGRPRPQMVNEFKSPAAPEVSNSKSRFVEAGSNHRWVWWKEAGHAFKSHPVDGTGAGSFRFTNLRYRGSSVDVTTEPHSLPVQFLTETGAVGGASFGGAMLPLVLLA